MQNGSCYFKTTLIWFLFHDWDFLYIPECLTNHDCPHCHDHQFPYCSGRYYTCGCEGNIITKDDDRFLNCLKEHCYLAMAQAQLLSMTCYFVFATLVHQNSNPGHGVIKVIRAHCWSQSHFYKLAFGLSLTFTKGILFKWDCDQKWPRLTDQILVLILSRVVVLFTLFDMFKPWRSQHPESQGMLYLDSN